MPAVELTPTPPFVGGTGSLEGKVYDAESLAPVAGADVYLRLCSGGPECRGVLGAELTRVYITDETGRFRVPDLLASRYQVDVEAPGYLRHVTQSIETLYRGGNDDMHVWSLEGGIWDAGVANAIGASSVVDSLLPLVRSDSIATVEVALRRGRRVSGSVNDSSGTPVKGATVRIDSQRIRSCHTLRAVGDLQLPPNRPAVTDDNGKYSITAHPSASITLRVEAQGHLYKTADVHLPTLEGEVDFTLGEATTLTGTAYSADGEPLPDAHIGAFVPRKDGKVLETMTENDGSFELSGVGHDPLIVVASSQHRGAYDVALPEPMPDIELYLQEPRRLRGRVLDEKGNALAGVLVGQRPVIIHQGTKINLMSHEPAGKHRVVEHDDGSLNVYIFIVGDVATTDEEGRFDLGAILDQRGKAFLSLSTSEGSFATGSMECDVDIRKFVTITFTDPKRASCLTWLESLSVEDRKRFTAEEQEKEHPIDDTETAAAEVCESTRRKAAPDQILEWIEFMRTGDKEERRQLICQIRNEAERNCGGHPPKRSSQRLDLIPVFVAGLNNGDSEVRSQAICALAYMNCPDTLPHLLEALKNEVWTVRHFAIMGLNWLGKFPDLKGNVVRALVGVRDAGEEGLDLRSSAAASLVELGEQDDPKLFLEALRIDEVNHAIAAGALAKLGRRESIELLIEVVGRVERPYRYHCSKALEKLTGETLGESHSKWQAWLKKHRHELPKQDPVLMEPMTAEGYIDRAWRKFSRNELDAAIGDVTKAICLEPKDGSGYLVRAYIRIEQGNLDQALSDYDKAVKLGPDDPKAYCGRGHAWQMKGALEKALSDQSKAIDLDPAFVAAYFNRGHVLKTLRRFKEAIADFEAALKIAPPGWPHRTKVKVELVEARKNEKAAHH